MEVKELRIGNYVNVTECGIGEVQGILEDKTILINNNRYTEKGVIPINLDFKWLKKLGFNISREYDKTYEKDYMYIYVNEVMTSDGIITIYIISIDLGFDECEIKRTNMSVHELQNIYHALIGEELKIK